MERQWLTMGNDTRANMTESKLPRNYVWYALSDSVDKRNTLPIKGERRLPALQVLWQQAQAHDRDGLAAARCPHSPS